MQSCSIRGCDSYKGAAVKNIGYFKFPLHDHVLLQKWLDQIGRPDWKPTEYNQICSSHFTMEDIDSHPNRKQPVLKPTAVPTMFLMRGRKAANNRLNIDYRQSQNQLVSEPKNSIQVQRQIIPFPVQNLDTANQPNGKLSVLIPKPVIIIPTQLDPLKNGYQMKPVTQTRLRRILPKPDNLILPRPVNPVLSTSGSLTLLKPLSVPMPVTNNKKPILRITIHKEYRKAPSPTRTEPFGSDHSDNETGFEIVKVENDISDSMDEETNSGSQVQVEKRCSKSINYKLLTTGHKSTIAVEQIPKSKTKDIVPTSTDTHTDVKNVSQDHVYSYPSASTSVNRLSYMYSKAQQDCNQLRKRLKILRQRHRREQDKITKLQGHLSQLGKKVRENYYKDYLESKARTKGAPMTVKSNECEDEYEKLLREVRKIKQKIQKANKNPVEPHAVLLQKTAVSHSDEEIYMMEELLDEGGMMEETEKKKNLQAEDDEGDDIIREIEGEMGEIIGEIDEDSIDMDFGAEAKSFIFKEEFLDSGLIAE